MVSGLEVALGSTGGFVVLMVSGLEVALGSTGGLVGFMVPGLEVALGSTGGSVVKVLSIIAVVVIMAGLEAIVAVETLGTVIIGCEFIVVVRFSDCWIVDFVGGVMVTVKSFSVLATIKQKKNYERHITFRLKMI
jgi:hypothetical protein